MTLSAFASAQDKNSEQQRALLGAIAESGSAGAASYRQAQEQNQQLQQGALAAASGIGRAGIDSPVNTTPTAQLTNTLALNQSMLGNAQGTFERDMARQSSANSDYMGQVGAAIPIVESRTRAGVEQILAEAAQKREAMAMEKEMALMSLQGRREEMAYSREERAAARSAKAAERAEKEEGGYVDLTLPKIAGGKTIKVKDGLTPYQREQIRLAEADNDRAAANDKARQQAAADKAREEKQVAYLNDLNARWAGKNVDEKGNVTRVSESYKAVEAVLNGDMSLDEALSVFKTPGGKKPLNRAAIQAELDRLNRLK